MGIEARLIFMNGVVVTPQLSLLDQWLSAFTKINTCPYNCTVKQISIFHNILKHIHVFCTYIIFMQRFTAFYCTLQEENIHATVGRVFIIPNKLQVLNFFFCKELWIQRLKTVSKIYHFVSLHQQSIGIVFCWADELEGLFCDGLLYKAASKIIFSLIFIQQQRFDFNHLLQKTCSDRCMIWNIAGNSVEMIKVIFCCHLTWPAKDLTFFCKNCIVKYDLKHCWKIITPLCMSIARSLGKILFGFEHGKHDLFKASQGHHHFTQFWNLKLNYQKEKREFTSSTFLVSL